MEENTRDKIIRIARKQIHNKGYEKTTIRSIANEAEIAIGNLQFYFQKKEQLMAEIFTSDLLDFYKKYSHVCSELDNPWIEYFSMEGAYLLSMLRIENMLSTYLCCVNIPLIRQQYISINNELLLKCFEHQNIEPDDKQKIYFISLCISGGEFEIISLISQRLQELSGKLLFDFPYKSGLLQYGIEKDIADDIISSSYTKAKEISDSYVKELLNIKY